MRTGNPFLSPSPSSTMGLSPTPQQHQQHGSSIGRSSLRNNDPPMSQQQTAQQQQQQQRPPLEVSWDVTAVCQDLHKASIILSERCLKLSAKWAAEQCLGLQQQHGISPQAFYQNLAAAAPPPPPVPTKSNSSIGLGSSSSSVFSDPTYGIGITTATTTSNAIPIPDGAPSSSSAVASSVMSSPAVVYAKTLLELGEYAHAAAVLSKPPPAVQHVAAVSAVDVMPPPLPNLAPPGIFLRAYALYMAGEKRKEEEYMELKSDAQKHATPKTRNPYLAQLSEELYEAYQSNLLDAFGLHVYGMVLNAAAESGAKGGNGAAYLPPNTPPAHTVLIQSILQFPWSWSAWLDLAKAAIQKPTPVERDIEEQLGFSSLGGHYMYHFFCAHLQAEHQAHAEALAIYDRWMDPALFGSSGSPYLVTQYATSQYHLRNFATAKQLLQDLHDYMPFRLESMEIFSNILYVQEDSVALSQLAHTAVQVDKYRAETCCIVGNYYSLKQQRAKAIQYFQRALAVDRSFNSAWTLMGHEYVEWKQTANAMEAYRRAVEVAPSDYRAWYGLGQMYELLNMHLYALYYFKKAAQLRPYDARMWCALGLNYVQLHRTEDAIRAYERALQQDDTEGIATQKLAALYKQEGQEEKAAQCYYRHLQLRFQVTASSSATVAAAAANGGASRPMNLDTLLQALVVDGPEAEALLYLALYHKDHAEYDTAAQLASRLLEYPGPEKEQAKALLRELRYRKSHSNRRVIHTRSKGPVTDTSFEFSP